jgi:hypothetical protein
MRALRAVAWFVRDYVSRHRNPWNRALHLVGVPLALVVSVYLLVLGKFLLAAAAFVVGYVLQWIGHRIEGNEVGEWALVQKLARRPGRGKSEASP